MLNVVVLAAAELGVEVGELLGKGGFDVPLLLAGFGSPLQFALAGADALVFQVPLAHGVVLGTVEFRLLAALAALLFVFIRFLGAFFGGSLSLQPEQVLAGAVEVFWQVASEALSLSKSVEM